MQKICNWGPGSPRAQGAALRTARDASLDPSSGRCPDPSSPEAGKGAEAPFRGSRMIREPYVKGRFAAYPHRRPGRLFRYSTVPLTTVPLTQGRRDFGAKCIKCAYDE